MKSNFPGTSNLIEYGITHSMERFLYVSSGEVYEKDVLVNGRKRTAAMSIV